MNKDQQNTIKIALSFETGSASFPNIYFGKEHVGGFDDLVEHLREENIFQDLLYKNGIVPHTTATDATDGENSLAADVFDQPKQRTVTKDKSLDLSPTSLKELRE